MIKTTMGFLAAMAVFAVSVAAAPVAPDVATWAPAPDPDLGETRTDVTATQQTITFLSTKAFRIEDRYGAYVSDVSSSGIFDFSGSMLTPVSDRVKGIVFGYEDGLNNIRIGWGGGGGTDSNVSPEPGGLFMIEETAGVASLLYHDASNNWTAETSYDFRLRVTGSLVDFEVRDGTTIVGSFTETVTRDTAGKFGVYVGGQPAMFSNLLYDLDTGRVPAVPLPAALPLLLGGLGALGLLRRRRVRVARR